MPAGGPNLLAAPNGEGKTTSTPALPAGPCVSVKPIGHRTMTATTGPPDISEQAVTPARPAPPPMEKDWVLIGLVVAAISLIVALIGLGAMGFFHLDGRIDSIDSRIDSLDSRIDAQGAELRTAISAQGAELREGFKHVDQRIDGLYDLIAQGRR